MSFFGPRHTASETALEIAAGLRDGTVVIGDFEGEVADQTIHRRSWLYLAACAVVLFFALILQRIRRAALGLTIDTALNINAQASTAIQKYIRKDPSPTNLETISQRANAIAAISGPRKPPQIISALVTVKAAQIAFLIPNIEANRVINVTVNLRGRATGSYDARTDAFVAYSRFTSSGPEGPSKGIVVHGNARVVAYHVLLEGLTQTLNGPVWVESSFQHCRISYDGGPIYLSKCVFKDCILDDSLKAVGSLTRLVVEAGGSPLSFVYQIEDPLSFTR